MAYIVTDRTGRYLLSASYPGSKLALNPIAANGQVEDKTTQVIPTPPKAHCIVVDPSNKYCYATSLGGDIIMQWKFDPAPGTLQPNTPDALATKPGNGPRHLAFHPNRHFLYLLTETTARIAGYTIDPATGTLKDIEIVDTLPADFKEQPAAADLHVSPDGRFLYGSERKSSTLAGLRIDDATGKLSAIGRFPTEKTPRGFAIDPRGRFLLSVGLASNAMSVHATDSQSGRPAARPARQWRGGGRGHGGGPGRAGRCPARSQARSRPAASCPASRASLGRAVRPDPGPAHSRCCRRRGSPCPPRQAPSPPSGA